MGFTTSEAESITSQPARRPIASVLTLLGNAGIVSIIASLVLGFAETAPRQALQRLGVLVAGLGLLLVVVRSERFAALLSRMLERRVARWADLDTRDYVRLLGISDFYAVRESKVEPNGWLAGRELSELDLPREGVLVLGVRRSDGTYLGAPAPGTTLRAGDHVLLYGHRNVSRRWSIAPRVARVSTDAIGRSLSIGTNARRRQPETPRPTPARETERIADGPDPA